ncbi:MAG: HAD-IA family hydrolase [Alphaproteobacteria bacterium]
MLELPLRLAVFDCDGTLVDSLHVIAAAAAEAFKGLGLPPPKATRVQAFIGLPLIEALDRLAPAGADREALRDGYVKAYRALIADPAMHEPLYEGAAAALEKIAAAGVLLGIATGKGRRGLDAVLERHGLSGKFVTLQTSDRGPGKPDPAMLLAAMSEAGVGPGETVMIGDTTFDILMAANAGVAAIGVEWGYHAPADLSSAGAAMVACDYAEIPPAVARLTGGQRCD